MAQDLTQRLKQKSIRNPHFIGIRTGGIWVAQALLKSLDVTEPLGVLDVSFYRDDFTQKGLHPQVQASVLPFDIDNQHIVLIDDILMSGRTIRAAMNEIFDYGRPSSITFVCLLSLTARELPIRPDIVGAQLALEKQQRVKLTGPSPMQLELQTISITNK
ncbi:UNVERIFIED_CONTAM: hypothetical protein GTU68_052157 [Idotea baltica]|nr:hypothetical protein [Idotea baltica]